MAELVAPAPSDCVGPSSEQAGKASSCEGCPNQKICATAPKGPDPDLANMADRLSAIKHKILVLSGKGGVGKSTFSAQLSFALAHTGAEVGLLDVDICGPSIPKMLGLEGEQIHSSNLGWSPVYVQENLGKLLSYTTHIARSNIYEGVMSVGFLLDSENDAIIWRGPRKNALIKQFLMDVYWEGGLDFLVVDTPPGTSDEHLSISQYLKSSGDVGHAIIITTPQDVALIDVRKEINFCKKIGIPILGVVENMSAFVCPKCQKETVIFGSTSGGAEAMAKDMGVPFLGRIPLDPTIARACDEGKSYVADFPDSVATKQFLLVFKSMREERRGEERRGEERRGEERRGEERRGEKTTRQRNWSTALTLYVEILASFNVQEIAYEK